MQENAAEYAKNRIAVFAICSEPPARLAEFVAQNNISYNMLSDRESEVIGRLGILNTEIAESDPVYGIPYPGSYLVDESGVVFEKRFHPDFHVREPMSSLLLYFQLKEYTDRLEEKVQERTMQLIDTAKLATLGKLIAAINHELNTPLGTLANGMDVVWKYFDRSCETVAPKDRAGLTELKNAIDAACKRIIQVVADLREFIRLDQSDLQTVDLRHSLDAVTELLGSQLDGRIRVERQYEEIPKLELRAPQMNQALFEVLTNAVESIPSEGTITLRTRREDGDVVITVADTGRGIPAAELDQLFEPRLRAKGSRVGVGLGLPLAHKIVHEHGGRIEVSSTPGQGTMVTIRLPR